jgi:hypothetical protein
VPLSEDDRAWAKHVALHSNPDLVRVAQERAGALGAIHIPSR